MAKTRKERTPKRPPKPKRSKASRTGEAASTVAAVALSAPTPAAPAAAPRAAGRAAGLTRLLSALEAIEEGAARGMVAKAAAGTGLTKAELDSIPRLRERLRDRLARADAEDEAEAAEAPRAAAEAPVGGVVNTYREVGDHFGRGERAVQNWKADGMPVRPGGGYDLAEIAAWLREKHPKALGGGSQREKREYFEARYRELKCELLELQVKIERGDLLDRGVEEANTMEIVRNFRDELLSIAPSVAPQLVGLDALTIKSVLDARLRDSLGNLATTLGAEAEEVCEAGALPGGMQDG